MSSTEPFRPTVSVGFNEQTRGVVLQLQARADGPILAIRLTADEALALRSQLDRAVDDRDSMRADLDELGDLPETDEPA